jgi:hypothetical protein
MAFVSRGFRGRRAGDADPARVPPGQYVTRDFPVLSAGPTPHTSLELWDFSIIGELEEPRRWNWEEFRALPSEEITRDIHCVTKWSKLDTVWQGVSVDTLLAGMAVSQRPLRPSLSGSSLVSASVAAGRTGLCRYTTMRSCWSRRRLMSPGLRFFGSSSVSDAHPAVGGTFPGSICRAFWVARSAHAREHVPVRSQGGKEKRPDQSRPAPRVTAGLSPGEAGGRQVRVVHAA